MLMENPAKILNKFSEDLALLAKRTLIENGVKDNSNLINSLEFIPTNTGLQLLANDYYTYLSTGRKPKARKVPIEDLIVWIKRYNISSGNVNQIAWAIQQAIFKNGIKAKNFINPVIENIADYSAEQLAEEMSEQLADDFVESLKQN